MNAGGILHTDDDPTDVAALDDRRIAREKQARIDSIEERGEFVWLMSSRRGRRIVWRLLDKAGVYRSSFSAEPGVMAFQEGMRNIGLMIVAQIHAAAPGSYVRMIEEHRNGRSGTGSTNE